MRHALLVVRAIGRQLVAHLIERLAQPGDIAMAEDRPDAAEDRHLLAVDHGHLPRHERASACAMVRRMVDSILFKVLENKDKTQIKILLNLLFVIRIKFLKVSLDNLFPIIKMTLLKI
jgi:hypothetical protein